VWAESRGASADGAQSSPATSETGSLDVETGSPCAGPGSTTAAPAGPDRGRARSAGVPRGWLADAAVAGAAARGPSPLGPAPGPPAPGATFPAPAGAAGRVADAAGAPGGRQERSGQEAAREAGTAGGGDAERRALQAAVFAQWRAAAARASAERVRRSAHRERAPVEPSEPMPSAPRLERVGGMRGPDSRQALFRKGTIQRELEALGGLAGWSHPSLLIDSWCHHTPCDCRSVERVCAATCCSSLHQPPEVRAATAGAAGM
jgi:hypothetical protein